MSHLDSLDVSFCYSLQRLANPNSWTKGDGCDHLVEFQDRIKQELIQKFDSHMFRIRGFCAEGEEDKWLIQNEFVGNFSFKISSPPPAHRICGFNLFLSCVTSAYRGSSYVYIEIRNNTSGLSTWAFK